jgi:hypothetical protein
MPCEPGTKNFVADLRELNIAPHVAQNTTNRASAIDGRTTRHPGYAVNQIIRKRIEESFACSLRSAARPRHAQCRGLCWIAGTEPQAWRAGLMNDITYVGLDVHKATVCVAIAESGRGGEVREVGIFENRPDVLRKMVARLGKQRHRLNFCYEAGPCGYGLHRLLTGLGHDCVVVAP